MSGQQNYNEKYSELGSEIKQSVLNAINSGDFSGLSDSVSKTVFTALGDVGAGINKAATKASQGISFSEEYKVLRREAIETANRFHEKQEANIRRNKELRAATVRKPNPPVKFNSIGSVSGPISTILGAGTSIIAGVATITTSLVFIGAASVVTLVPLIFSGAFTLGSVGLIASGVKKQRLYERAKKYKALCSEKMYCAVDDIASATGMEQKKVVKDIKKMLEKGFFPEGYLDDDATTLMISKEVYEQYLKVKENSVAISEAEAEAEELYLDEKQQSELNAMMSEGQKYIERLRYLNEEIVGEEFSNKLNITEGLLNDIFARVRQYPEQMKNCHKLMDYHLPTMVKLVEAYVEYDKVNVPSAQIIKAKEEIEKTTDIINQAFTELLNRLFQDSVWDVTADAKVLKTMLTQEGLAKDMVVID